MVKTFFQAILKYFISFQKSGRLKPPQAPRLRGPWELENASEVSIFTVIRTNIWEGKGFQRKPCKGNEISEVSWAVKGSFIFSRDLENPAVNQNETKWETKFSLGWQKGNDWLNCVRPLLDCRKIIPNFWRRSNHVQSAFPLFRPVPLRKQ